VLTSNALGDEAVHVVRGLSDPTLTCTATAPRWLAVHKGSPGGRRANQRGAPAGHVPLIQQVNDDHEPVRINSKGGDAVLMSAQDFDSWQETIYLLRSPANARRLMEASCTGWERTGRWRRGLPG
jgi:prevent-host-death family protein